MMQGVIRDGRTKSAIAMLARDDQVLWLKTAGEMGPGVPMREDAIIPLASIGKMFTAAAAMILVERGRISLDDPVSKYIPEFSGVRIPATEESGKTGLVPATRPITVYHLLTHTSGLAVSGDDFWAAWNENSQKTTTTAMARSLAALPLHAQPGERFEYGPTGASYEVLAAVIEIASGQTLEAFMIGNIFQPLGLNDTYFFLLPDKTERLPAFYRNVDGVRILSAESVRQMISDQLGGKAPQGMSWGFGAAVLAAPSGEHALYGWNGGGYAVLWVDPNLDLIAFFAMPLMPPGDGGLLQDFRRLVYQGLAGSAAGIKP